MKVLSVGTSATEQPESRMVTVSRIRDSVCPLKYYKNYMEDPRPAAPFTALETGLGGFFHTYLEKHFKAVMGRAELLDRSQRIDVADLLRAFRMSFLWENKPRAPYRIVEAGKSPEEYVESLKAVGENFNAFLASELSGHKVLGVEGDIEIRTDRLTIYGKYDLITDDPKGRRRLWDWKTGPMPQPRDFDEYRNTRLQLGIYAVWMKHHYRLEEVPATAVFFRDGAQTISETFSDAVEREVLEYLDTWRRKLNRLESHPPVLNDQCDRCGWNPVCPAYQEKTSPKGRKGRGRNAAMTALEAAEGPSAAAPAFSHWIHRFRMELLAVGLGALLAGVLLYLHFTLGIWR